MPLTEQPCTLVCIFSNIVTFVQFLRQQNMRGSKKYCVCVRACVRERLKACACSCGKGKGKKEIANMLAAWTSPPVNRLLKLKLMSFSYF
jgi:hypothetical protein